FSASTYREDGYSATAAISLSETLTGRLEIQQQTFLEDDAGHRVSAWWLKLPNAEHVLQPGYSGSPVVDTASGVVIGIINIRKAEGQRGLAISAQALDVIWPQRPADLFDTPKRLDWQKPVINLDDQREAFARIVSGEDTQTRLLLAHGEAGMGKTHLVNMYEQIAEAHHCKTISVDLKEQLSVERCLAHIVLKLGGVDVFQQYNDAKMELTKALNAAEADKWELLTGYFFSDLRHYQASPQIILIFDGYDRDNPEEAFKSWLTGILLPQLANQTRLVTVIAGQELVTPPRELTRCHQNFPLTGVSVETYQDYAAACRVELPLDHLQLLHEAFHGKPSSFAYFIKERLAKSQQQEARYAG
ncbi:MAG: AAA family ATPase, partial [Rhodobacteraceae bacterium]|nr:AAA family ATPase [Paracoccaceae bacterium]